LIFTEIMAIVNWGNAVTELPQFLALSSSVNVDQALLAVLHELHGESHGIAHVKLTIVIFVEEHI
jgi:hypothetical protein